MTPLSETELGAIGLCQKCPEFAQVPTLFVLCAEAAR